jgi:hypothetical protein
MFLQCEFINRGIDMAVTVSQTQANMHEMHVPLPSQRKKLKADDSSPCESRLECTLISYLCFSQELDDATGI